MAVIGRAYAALFPANQGTFIDSGRVGLLGEACGREAESAPRAEFVAPELLATRVEARDLAARPDEDPWAIHDESDVGKEVVWMRKIGVPVA